ncbi:hypothetical protein KX816_04880 [Sphingosinicellaceae bacterium]|nr:hypothetical protein KX816_04880 [Sphingosinicellaceae bacterium]
MTVAAARAPDAEPVILTPVQETALYPAVKVFLEAQGFEVKGEICGCDVVAVREGEPPLVVVTELKLSFTLELVLQAVDRFRAADQVYLAVTASRRGRDQDGRVHRLCRLLGLGLLTVDTKRGMVTVVAEPQRYRPRADLPLRRRLLKEHAGRRGDPTSGGSTRQPIMTAYRQRAMACAEALHAGPLRPRDLKLLADDAGAILRRNVYGWFARVKPGVYGLSSVGTASFPTRPIADTWADGNVPLVRKLP